MTANDFKALSVVNCRTSKLSLRRDSGNFLMWFVGDYNNRSHAVNRMLSTKYVLAGADTFDYQSVHK